MNLDLTLYTILGVEPDADAKAIKVAYTRMAKWAHPDKAGETNMVAKMIMPLVNEAYDILSDAEKRHKYDQQLAAQAAAKSAARPQPRPGQPSNWVQSMLNDAVKSMLLTGLEKVTSRIKGDA